MNIELEIKRRLEAILFPQTNKGLLTSNIITGLHVDEGGCVQLVMDMPADQMKLAVDLKEDVIKTLKAIPGVTDVQCVMTSEKQNLPPKTLRMKTPIAGVKHIILVGSGKGGVGKSTTAVNIAAALHTQGLNVGIVDADVYGPSLHRLMGINERPRSEDGKTMEPLIHQGLQLMSIGFLVAQNLPTIWRGPMIHKALMQMLRQVNWKDVDVLVVDMPPGTGDVPLSLASEILIDGAVVVSTPQDLALIDVRKAIAMFETMEIPLLGMIENMSTFVCPHCEGTTPIFSHGGAAQDASQLGIPFLGDIPLHMDIRVLSDAGTPIVLAQPESPQAKAYQQIAGAIWDALQERRSQRVA